MRRRLGVAGVTALVAVVVNQGIFALGRALGADYAFVSAGADLRVDALTLAGFTALPLLVGLVVVALLMERLPWVLPVALVVGPVLALGSIVAMVLPAGLDTLSAVAIGLCHAALVPAVVGGLLALRAPVRAQRDETVLSPDLAA